MSELAMAELSMKRCLLDMPYDILFEIFRRLPIDKLIEISKLCLKFRDVAEDPRLWKDVIIKYDGTIPFEELYSKPWPVKVIDLQQAQIEPPVSSGVSSKTDQAIKVIRLNLSMITADKVTLEAILDKYQCTELYLSLGFNSSTVDVHQGRIESIAPEVFSKQTALEVLSVRCFWCHTFDIETETMIQLAPVLNNCKNLKTLYFRTFSANLDLFGYRFVKNLTTSLEKLFLGNARHNDRFSKLLAENAPNLRELELCASSVVMCPSLLRFQFLEALYVLPCGYSDISDLYEYLIKFPALKTVNIGHDPIANFGTSLVKLRTTLKPHGIIVRTIRYPEVWPYHEDQTKNGCVWKVSKAM